MRTSAWYSKPGQTTKMPPIPPFRHNTCKTTSEHTVNLKQNIEYCCELCQKEWISSATNINVPSQTRTNIEGGRTRLQQNCDHFQRQRHYQADKKLTNQTSVPAEPKHKNETPPATHSLGSHASTDPPGRSFSSFFWKRINGQARLFELLHLLRNCGRCSCCCRRLVVGKDAVVPIVLNVAVDVAGGEWGRNMSVLQYWRVRSSCGRNCCVVAPVVVIGGPPRLWRAARAFCCSGQDSGECGP